VVFPSSVSTAEFRRATAQAVSRRLSIVEARARAQARSCGICLGQSCTGAGFLRVLQFPLPILIPVTAYTHQSSGAGATGQIVADVPGGLSLTSLHETKETTTTGSIKGDSWSWEQNGPLQYDAP
jgi:hypothetical protein